MDVIIDWNLGNTIYHGLITLRLCGFPIAEIGVVSHDVFHVSQLKKCLRVPEEQIPLEELIVKENLTYEKFPVKILERRGEVAYQLELPESLSGVHDMFHVSQLKKCLRIPKEQISLEELTVKEDLT